MENKSKNFDFTIKKSEIKSSFTLIPNEIINELMHYITHNELRLILYVYQKDNEFKYNRNRIAQKFGIHKNNVDKIFADLLKKRILIKTSKGLIINLFVNYDELRTDKTVKSNTKSKSYNKEKHVKKQDTKLNNNIIYNCTPSTTLSNSTEVKNTSSQVNFTSLESDKNLTEVNYTSHTEVNYTSPKKPETTNIDSTCSDKISLNNTNYNKTNTEELNKDKLLTTNNSNSIICNNENHISNLNQVLEQNEDYKSFYESNEKWQLLNNKRFNNNLVIEIIKDLLLINPMSAENEFKLERENLINQYNITSIELNYCIYLVKYSYYSYVENKDNELGKLINNNFNNDEYLQFDKYFKYFKKPII